MPRSPEFPHSMLATFSSEQWLALAALAEEKRWPKTEVLRWLVEGTLSDGTPISGTGSGGEASGATAERPGTTSAGSQPSNISDTHQSTGVPPTPPSDISSSGGPTGESMSPRRPQAGDVTPNFKGRS